jgi:recombination protein RecA
MSLFDKELAKQLKDRDMLPYGVEDVTFLPTGIFGLDYAFGGGIPRKRITEIAGKNQTAKTLTALLIAQTTIVNGGRVAWFEAEEALDPLWMLKMGIPANEVYWDENDSLEDTHLHIFHPPYLERGLETLRALAASGIYDLIVYDSIGGSPTLAAYNADLEDQQMTQTARVMSRFRAVLPQDIKKGNSAVLLLNTVIQNIGQKFVDPLLPYGGTLIPSGGEGLAFLASVRIFMYGAKKVEGADKEVIGKMHSGRIYKNKVTGAREFHFELKFEPDYYVDIPQDIADTALILGLVEKRGRFWFYKGENIAGGEKDFKDKLVTDMDFTIQLQDEIREGIIASRQKKTPMLLEDPPLEV